MDSLEDVGIGRSNRCFIIAEAGQNHQGNLEHAKEMIRVAKECGASCVKFQKSDLQERFARSALEAPYDSVHSFGATYGQHRARLEFSESEMKELQRYAHKLGIPFLVTPMDISSANLLLRMKLPFLKIGSGDTNNFPLIEHIAKAKVPLILSTGMSSLDDVRSAYNIITKYHQEVALLHCVSAYPTQPEDVNLSAIVEMRKEFPQTVIGYSGHEKGIHIALAAVAMGARVIEKHFTLDKSQKGSDHQCSLDPSELADLVKQIRDVEDAYGDGVKVIKPCEFPCLKKLGKSIVAARTIQQNAVIQREDLAIKVSRPEGLRPELIDNVVGQLATRVIEEDSPILNFYLSSFS